MDPQPLDNASSSLDELGRATVAALNEGDERSLSRIALSKDEYFRLYPQLANGPTALKFGPERAWTNLSVESNGDLRSALADYGGRNLSYVALKTAEPEKRNGLEVLREPRLTAKTPEGKEIDLIMFGPLVLHVPTGGYKLITFRDTR